MLIWLLALQLPVLAAPVGMATQVQGGVQVTGRPLVVLQPLETNQVIELAKGAHLEVILYADGHTETVNGPARVSVGAAGLQGVGVTRGSSQNVAAAAAGRDIQRYGGDRQRSLGSLVLLTPNIVKPGGPIQLSWQGERGPYLVRLGGPVEGWVQSCDTSQALWEANCATNTITYAGPPLQADVTYWWEVAPDDVLTASAVRRGLRIESPQAAQNLTACLAGLGDSYSDQILKMVVWSRAYHLPEALAQGQRAAQLQSDPGLDDFLLLLRKELGP